ncbi:cellulose/xylan binding protein with CBM9 domain [Flavobacteriaceae bacterium MAR_2009_75]|nr:cellulose/xylan binding protein with CBM9 domain [Flavobacteriaceae bacterium MAR_2009_75]
MKCIAVLFALMSLTVKAQTDNHNMELKVKEIKYTDKIDLNVVSRLLEEHAENNRIATLNWDSFSYLPLVEFRIARHENNLWLKFNVSEENILAQFTEPNSSTHKDSCVEFFVDPLQNGNYYNFEFNCIGTTHLAYGPDRHDRKFVDPKIIQEKIQVKSSLGDQPFKEKGGGHNWEMTIIIPADIFVFSDKIDFSDLTAKANFYKCGDDTSKQHYVSWNSVDTDRPDFHRSEFFGTLVFD